MTRNRRCLYTDAPKGYHTAMIGNDLLRRHRPATDRPEHPNRGGRKPPLSYEETIARLRRDLR